MIPEPTMTSKHADLLNELDRMQGLMNLAAYRRTISQAEKVIVVQETELAKLRERVRELEDQGEHVIEDGFCKYCDTSIYGSDRMSCISKSQRKDSND